MMEKPYQMSAAALAYLGDAVLELCVREHLVSLGISSSLALNKQAFDFVRAKKQAEAMKNLYDILTEEETDIFRRGRNIGHTNTPKSATTGEYRTATGMEALFGFLHLSDRKERINFLFCTAFSIKKSDYPI